MFEDEYYLQSQLEALKQAIRLLMTQYRTEGRKARRQGGKLTVPPQRPQKKPNKTETDPSAMAEGVRYSAFGRLPLAGRGRIRSRCD